MMITPEAPSLFLLFNHTLTEAQRVDALNSLGIGEFIEPPQAVQKIWGDIPSENGRIYDLLTPVREWLGDMAIADDYVLIQGDFGACCLMVDHAQRLGLIPIYSTTRREAYEERLDDGAVRLVHRFRHVRFREYGQ
jgi:hypothetical protein